MDSLIDKKKSQTGLLFLDGVSVKVFLDMFYIIYWNTTIHTNYFFEFNGDFRDFVFRVVKLGPLFWQLFGGQKKV